jgi:hypothetical protein
MGSLFRSIKNYCKIAGLAEESIKTLSTSLFSSRADPQRMNSLHGPWILRIRQNITCHAGSNMGPIVTQTTASLESYCILLVFSAHFQYPNSGGYIEHTYTGLFLPKTIYTTYDLGGHAVT